MIFVDEEKYKDLTGIYQIFNKVNNKVYIGQTSERFQRRYWHHNWNLSNGSHHNKFLQNSWNKYGSNNFEFRIIHVLKDGEDINLLEKQYIKQFNATEYEYGYNMQDGGQPESMHRFISEESRKIVGEKNRQHMLGRKLSDETRAKMRASSKHCGPGSDGRKRISEYMSNRTVSDATKEKLRVINTGSKSPVTHLTEDDVLLIKIRLMNHELQKYIAADYNVSLGAISAIANDVTWKHVKVEGWSDYLKSKK